MFDSLFLTLGEFASALRVLAIYWWTWLPLVLLFSLYESIQYHSRLKYLSEMKWLILEIKIPADTHRSPKAMEQMIAALHVIGATFQPKGIIDKFKAWRTRVFDGKTLDWMSFEIVGMDGEIHFYARILETHKHVFEAQVYAHFPEAELSPVPDYMARLPVISPNDEYESNGQELGLTKDDAYPIRTYPEFEEEKAGKDDAKRVDPLAPLAEALNAMNPGEYFGVQFLLRSSDDSWVKKAQATMDKIFEKPEKPRNDILDKAVDALGAGLDLAFPPPAVDPKKEEKKEGKKFLELGTGTQEVVKAIERNFAKLGFYTGIRVMYIARKDRYVKERMGAVMATFKLFTSQAANGFKPTFSTEVYKGFHKAQRALANKKYVYARYRTRAFPEKPFILTTEEVATVYHFPDVAVKTASLPRVEAKKGEAPAGLPIV